MKTLKFLAAAAVLAAVPAFAQTAPSDTLALIIQNGIKMNVPAMGAAGEVAYKADGTFSGFDGQYSGTYKIDGTKLCSTSAIGEDNTCIEYPTGKKSGDTFKLTHPIAGEVEITIK
jgi:hypothetical protein